MKNHNSKQKTFNLTLLFFVLIFAFFSISNVAHASAPTSGLVGYWNFDEGSGTTAADYSGNGNTGTITGATWTTGKVGKGALDFNGVSDYINAGTGSSLTLTGDMAVSAWVNINDIRLYDTIISYAGAVGNPVQYAFELCQRKVSFRQGNKSCASDNQGNTILNTGQWYHIAAVRTGSSGNWSVALYVNGALDKVISLTLDPSTSNLSPVRIGSNISGGSNYFDGSLDDVRIYNRALSTQEVLDIYNDTGSVTDTTPPAISGIASSAVTSSSATITWITDEVSNSQVEYGTTVSYGSASALNSSLTTSHSLSLSGLSASTLYHYRVKSSDASGNLAISNDQTFITSVQAGDATPPSVPTNLSATAVSSSQINLSWNASTDNVGVTGYRVYRNGSQITTTANTSYSDNNLSASTNYSYTVSAYDAAGNSSAQSSAASATTQSGIVSGNNIYIAQDQSGTGDGSSCANAYAVSFFNTAANWGAGAGQIGPGTIVHLCGTFTGAEGSNMLTTHGNGNSGNPATILFEPGAVLTAPYWSASGALIINNSYVVVDGGANGIIEATANGTLLANQADSEGINIGWSGLPHDVEIKNLTIRNLCVREANSTNTSCVGTGVSLKGGGGNIWVHDNTIHDVSTGVFYTLSATGSGDLIYNNTIYNHNWATGMANCTNLEISGAQIYGNSIGSSANWDQPSDYFHHDGFHYFNCGGKTGVLSETLVYNNYFYGDPGVYSTGQVFFEGYWTGTMVFNNVFINTSNNYPNDGVVFLKGPGTGSAIINNTFISHGIPINISSDGNTVENNIIVGITGIMAKVSATVNYNLYYNTTLWVGPPPAGGGRYYTFSGWKFGTGLDANSAVADPKLDGAYHIQADSPAIGEGVNLTSLGITALNSDKIGVIRPTFGPWDIGAYQYTGVILPSDTTPPSPPINVQVN
jgi:chitodextrinase